MRVELMVIRVLVSLREESWCFDVVFVFIDEKCCVVKWNVYIVICVKVEEWGFEIDWKLLVMLVN